MPLSTSLPDTVQTVLDRQADKRPTNALVYGIDGNFVDIRLDNSSAVLRHVDVVGDIDSININDTVQVIWQQNGRPMVLLMGGGSGTSVSSSVTPDNITIENSVLGLRVKHAGIGREHLGFSISDEVVRLNPLAAAGWIVDSDGSLIHSNIRISPSGEISLGSGNNILKLSAFGTPDDPNSPQDETSYRMWIGHTNPQYAPFAVTDSGELRASHVSLSGSVGSNNYLPGRQGWHADNSGWAEFQDVLVRGRLQGVTMEAASTSAIAGRMRVSDSTTFSADVELSAGFIDLASNAFQTDDILQSKPSIDRNEWMRVLDDGVAIDGSWRYTIERDLAGAGTDEFYTGETVVRLGHATYPESAPLFGDTAVGFGDPLAGFGGGGYLALGGFLTLEGGREYGPYFSVARRFGAAYNQISDVVRVGLLRGFLGVVRDEYGFAAGDETSYMLYSSASGLVIHTDSGQTAIDDDGITTEKFSILAVTSAPGYVDGQLVFYVDSSAKQFRGRYKDGAYESDTLIVSL